MFASVISGLLLLQLPLCLTVREESLAVYGPVPGLPPSPYYSLQVRVKTSHWSGSIQILCSNWLPMGALSCVFMAYELVASKAEKNPNILWVLSSKYNDPIQKLY